MELVKVPSKFKRFNFSFVPKNVLLGETLRKFIFGGKSLFTILNEDTGNYFTMTFLKREDVEEWDVYVLGNSGYDYFGCYMRLPNGGNMFMESDINHLKDGDRKLNVIQFLLREYLTSQSKYPQVKVFHHGNCGSCGKTLTKPKSIESGIGPVCGKFKNKSQVG